jgi:hypothetical protein
MFGYLKSKYESNLNEYNFTRLLEYNKLFNGLETEYLNLRDSTHTIFDEFNNLRSIFEKRRLTTNETNEIVIQLNFLIEKLAKKINLLKEISKEADSLVEAWKIRGSKTVINHHAKIFNPINSFPIPNLKLSGDLKSYSTTIVNAYVPGFNVFTRKYENEGNRDEGSSILNFLDNIIGSSKAKRDHEKKLYDLISEFRQANFEAVKKLDDQKYEIIKKSIEENLPESFSGNGVTFNLKKESTELKEKAKSAAKSLEIKLQEMKEVTKLANKNLGQDLQKMVEAKNASFLDALNKKRDLDIKLSTELDKESQKIISEKGTQIKDSLKKENTTNTDEAYSSLSEIFQNDALLAEKYLKGTLYNKEKNFLFNDKEFLNSYPLNSWSVFIRQLFSETIPQ